MEKINKHKKEILSLFLLFFITITALLLRIININVPTGLWNDESQALYIASQSFPFGIIDFLYRHDTHAPVYFFILHLWIKVFGNSDTSLRLSSILFGVINVPVIYLAGKELDSKKTGLLSATFVTINSFLIYYSQEVRFYSWLPLLASLSFLFVIKAIKKSTRVNLTLLMITNVLMMFTLTVGFVLVGLEIFIIGIYLYNHNKKELKRFLLYQIPFPGTIFLLYIPIIIHQIENTKIMFTHQTFDLSNVLLYLQNWFSPVFFGQYSNFLNYFDLLTKYEPSFFVYVLIPIIIAIIGIITATYKNSIARSVFLTVGLFFCFQIFYTVLGKFCIISRHNIIIIPIILMITAYGLLSIKNKLLSYSLIAIFLFINLFYMYFGAASVYRVYRDYGYNIPAKVIKQFNPDPNNIIIISEGRNNLTRYLKKEYGKIEDFSIFDFHISEEPDAYQYFRQSLISKSPLEPLEAAMEYNVVKKLGPKTKFIFIRNKYSYNINPEEIINIAKNDQRFEKESLIDLVYSKILNDIDSIASEHYELVSTVNKGIWIIKTYQSN